MSGSLSVVAFEGELNSIVREYLDFGGFDKTLQNFDKEISGKGKPLSSGDSKGPISQKQLAAQNELLELFHNGKRKKFFDVWADSLPKSVRENDSVAEKIEFYLNIYFAVYPIKFAKGQALAEKNMQEFKNFLETKGKTLSQTTEFLPFYALPFVPNPRNHPSYKELFTDIWTKDLEVRLEKFLTLALKSTPQPRLFDLYRGAPTEGRDHFHQVQTYQQQLVDAERKTMSYIKRHNKVQADYHSLIGITADLVDALEQTVQGKTISPEYLQQLCGRLFSAHMGQSVDLQRPGTAGAMLRQSVHQGNVSKLDNPEELSLVLDYDRLKQDLHRTPDRQKCLLLQALRWRLTQASPLTRDSTITAFIQHDLLGCAQPGKHRVSVLSLLTSSDPEVKQCAARLFNAFASLSSGRTYLAQNQDLFKGLMDNLRSEDKDSITREMVLGALQKLSLRRQLQSAMIDNGLIEWLVKVLEDNDSLSDYTLEYSVALLMNLCLRTSGKKRCAPNANQTLKVLSDLLGHDNQEIRPYVNGALYSILAISTLREEAKAMGMEEILRCFIKEDQPDMNRQVEFIIKQLNSTEVVDEYESDDEDDDEDEEDQDAMEVDLDKDEIIRAEGDEQVGEKLLAEYITGVKTKKRPLDMLSAEFGPLQRPVTPGQLKAAELMTSLKIRVVDDLLHTDSAMSQHGPLQRPVTPSQRKAAELSRPPSVAGSRPATGMKDITIRPPTRSGSRPSTQENEMRGSRPTSQKSNRQITPKPKIKKPEYEAAFGSRPKIPRTPDISGGKRPSSRGSISQMPPAPQFSESGPRPSSAGKSAGGSISPRKASAGSARGDSQLK
ncbi:lisH domain-containing protein ARMC9-like isoform X1 [Mya arenaria]|uniref:lisH domain-containing protein ARMC9-like isoform X1 n=2 Tax=Mya arenaria TaxID=6604 RepID=UPI0022E2C7DD|nr:lisH domain-containing protein ARMC9-like isoform X1 [Mya arenaria]XP_052760263.1 lisH domain-containing protein ARMC9-like isoform X1 [Mya arenaria]